MLTSKEMKLNALLARKKQAYKDDIELEEKTVELTQMEKDAKYILENKSLIIPLKGTITSRFGRRRSGIHTGLDIATSNGTPLKAAASGTVVYSAWKGSYGNLVIVDHGNGIQTYYAHCSRLYVSVGQTVSQGETIAAVGSTGNSTGPHLHLEIRVNGVAKNPQNYIY
mgnify:CR=1 FL=1